MMRQKICYILPFYEEGTDTHLFYNYELIRQLAARNEIDLYIILEKKKDRPNFGANCYEQKFSFAPVRFLEIVIKCLSLRTRGYKNFYIHYSYYGALAARLAGGRVFYWNRGMPWLFKRNWFEEAVFKFILRHTILVTGPESLAKEYQKRYGVKNYRVLSNWVDAERFKPANEKLFSGQKMVLFVHHLSKRKGADLIPEIAKGFENVLFLVAGDGPEKEFLGKCGVENIKILGKIPNSQIPDYFRSADIFLMPSREEGSPHVLLEAMASGTPFVASDVGGVRETVSEELGQFLCEPEDVECFQNKIKTLLSDKELYDKARSTGLAFSGRMNKERAALEFVRLF